jgi:RimJ/RimL family protein N-acetyltransferase
MAGFAARDRSDHMAHWHKILGDGAVTARTVLVNGQLAGNVVSWDQESRREVGYWIGRGYWGKGVATAALSQFLKVEGARPLYGPVAKHNLGSIRVLEKCGFVIDRASADADELTLILEHESSVGVATRPYGYKVSIGVSSDFRPNCLFI